MSFYKRKIISKFQIFYLLQFASNIDKILPIMLSMRSENFPVQLKVLGAERGTGLVACDGFGAGAQPPVNQWRGRSAADLDLGEQLLRGQLVLPGQLRQPGSC